MSDAKGPRPDDCGRHFEGVLDSLSAAENLCPHSELSEISSRFPDLGLRLQAFYVECQRIARTAKTLRESIEGARAPLASRLRIDRSTVSSFQEDSTEDLTVGPGSTVREAVAHGAAIGDAHAIGPVTIKVQKERDLLAGGSAPRFFGGYELIELLGRGGMGVVYKARQLSLNRSVALKMLQAGMLASDDDLRRFQNEAEAVALLDHPHIVPIFEIGRFEEQRYFTMKLIQGSSLDRKLTDYCESPKSAALVIARVSEAVHHAHQRGVLHRDLKPSNILLDERNEPHVTDFGLAKRMGADSDLTQSGAILGTPGYMAPEQAGGKRGAVTIATDVYGLGAVLYALLTGRGPFSGQPVAETLEQVRERRPQRPSELNPRVSRDLEIICLKCLEKEPARRYVSAGDLAEDLKRYAVGEPIHARAIGRLSRALMWSRRNPIIARLAVLISALAFVLLVSNSALFVLNDARRREADARGEAESNFKMALEAVDSYLTNVSENRLLKEQDTLDLRTLRQDLLKSALPFYKKFVHERSQDPKLQEQLANAHFRLGDITRVIGRSRDALGYYQSAQNLWEKLAVTDSANLEFQTRVADCDFEIGRLIGSENLPESLDWLNRALKVYQELVKQRPADPRFQSKLGKCCSEVAVCLSNRKEIDESSKYLNQARTIFQKLTESHPDQIDHKMDWAEIVNRIGYLDFKRLNYPAALEHYKEFQKLSQDILDTVKKGPKPLKIQEMLALSYFNIAVMYRDRADAERSLEASGKAIDNWTKLVELAPSVTSFKRELALTCFSRAWTLNQIGRDSEAEASADHALTIFDRLIEDEPESLDHQAKRADILNFKGAVHYEARRNEPARRIFQDVLKLRRSILAGSNGIERYKVDLCMGLQNLGEAYIYQGEVAKGLSLRREEIGLRQDLIAAHPEERGYAFDLVDAWVGIGDTQRLNSDPRGAGESYDHARNVLEPLLAAHPDDGDLRGKLAQVLERKANALGDGGEAKAAIDLLRQAADLARASVKAKTTAVKSVEVLSEVLWNLARLSRSMGDDTEAGRLIQERIELWKARPVAELLELAKLQAARAEEIGTGKAPLLNAGEQVRALDRDQAADTIKLAVKLGFKDLGKLGKNPDLAPLIKREGVAPLIGD
jgi:serine/threonine-protein kinase